MTCKNPGMVASTGHDSAEASLTPPPAAQSAPRLVSVDFFRGLALTFVLLNHLDWSADRKVFRHWTPVGLGFSDGAEAFVFLSGLTFGWVYSARLIRDGLRASQAKVLYRVMQIYLGYVLCLFLLTAFSFAPIDMTDWSRNPLRVGSQEPLTAALLRMLRLEQFPFALGILGLYLVILPVMLPLLLLAQRRRWAALAISIGLWAAVQPPLGLAISNPTCLAGWAFQPLAWQLLFVLGMLIGEQLRRTRSGLPRHAALTVIAAAIVIYGVFSAKRGEFVALTGLTDPILWSWLDLSQSWLTAKPHLGPLRIVHFWAVACLVTRCVPPDSRFWSSLWARPFIHTGRHSLTLYCCGTLMIYAAAVPLGWLGDSPTVVVTAGLAACLLQFGLAQWLEQRRNRRSLNAKLPASVSANRFPVGPHN